MTKLSQFAYGKIDGSATQASVWLVLAASGALAPLVTWRRWLCGVAALVCFALACWAQAKRERAR
jgi:ABC-type uncharacterized transport system permease subunit